MSIDQNTVICIHGMGFNCDSCYDHRFNTDWTPAKETVYQEIKTQLDKVKVPQTWPFHEPRKLDE